MVEAETIGSIRKFRSILVKEGIRVKKIILYGSRTTDKFRRDSDIDVAVISPDFGRDRFEEGTRLFKIAYKIDPRLEPVPVSPESYEKDTWLPLIYEIREKGIEVE